MDWLKLIHGTTTSAPSPAFGPGDEIRVWFKIPEQGKERLAQFEGTVIRCRGGGSSKTFTVRRMTYGEGVERIFPVGARSITRIEVLRQGRVRRSRLYFLRHVVGKTRIASAETPAPQRQSSARRQAAESPSTAPQRPERSTDAQGKVDRVENPIVAADRPLDNAASHA